MSTPEEADAKRCADCGALAGMFHDEKCSNYFPGQLRHVSKIPEGVLGDSNPPGRFFCKNCGTEINPRLPHTCGLISPNQAIMNVGKGASSSVPRFDLIPRAALISLASRFELGQQNYGTKAWNAATAQDVLDDREWVINRLCHVIDHATKAIMKLQSLQIYPHDDDAGAIMWGGAMLAAALERRPRASTAEKSNT